MSIKMTPKQWADGLKLLAEREEKKMPGIAVQVLKRSILAGPDHKNTTGWSERGDIVVIADGRYVRLREAEGVVTRHIEIPIFPTRSE